MVVICPPGKLRVHFSKSKQNEIELLARPASFKESLVTENEPDGMDAEQTWPTEEEMMEAEKEAKEKTKRVIKVPKGTSEYQAAWIMDKPGMATQLNSF